MRLRWSECRSALLLLVRGLLTCLWLSHWSHRARPADDGLRAQRPFVTAACLRTGREHACRACAAGRYATSGAAKCTDCPAGKTTQDGKGTQAGDCTACAAGQYLSGTVCSTCAAGRYAAAGATKCSDCAVGQTVAAGKGTQRGDCVACAAGKHAEVPALECGAVACRYFWYDIGSATAVSALTGHYKFPDEHDRMDKLAAGSFEVPKQPTGKLGAMIEGFVKAPETGEYHFFTNSDDESEVWAAEQPHTKVHLRKVVELKGGCCKEVAGSTKVQWSAGQLYYIRALVKAGAGSGYLNVGFQRGKKKDWNATACASEWDHAALHASELIDARNRFGAMPFWGYVVVRVGIAHH